MIKWEFGRNIKNNVLQSFDSSKCSSIPIITNLVYYLQVEMNIYAGDEKLFYWYWYVII